VHLPSTPLPAFTEDGLLPARDYPLTLDELRQSFLVSGEGVGSPAWDAASRGKLVDNLGILDKYGTQLQFPAAFRVRRSTYTPKGIILLRPH